MLLPSLNMNVLMFCQKLTIQNNTQTVVDYRPVQVSTQQEIYATIQVSDPEKLRINNVDFSLRYIEVHALPPAEIKINDTCDYKNKKYKCIDVYSYDDYEVRYAIFEEVK